MIHSHNQEASLKSDYVYHDKVFWMAKSFWKMIEKEWLDSFIQKGIELNITEYSILNCLVNHENLSVSDLAKINFIHISTALNFSKKLEQRQLIAIVKSKKDRRMSYVQMTDQGRNFINEVNQLWDLESSPLMAATKKVESVFGEKPDFKEILFLLKDFYGEEIVEDFLTVHE